MPPLPQAAFLKTNPFTMLNKDAKIKIPPSIATIDEPAGKS